MSYEIRLIYRNDEGIYPTPVIKDIDGIHFRSLGENTKELSHYPGFKFK